MRKLPPKVDNSPQDGSDEVQPPPSAEECVPTVPLPVGPAPVFSTFPSYPLPGFLPPYVPPWGFPGAVGTHVPMERPLLPGRVYPEVPDVRGLNDDQGGPPRDLGGTLLSVRAEVLPVPEKVKGGVEPDTIYEDVSAPVLEVRDQGVTEIGCEPIGREKETCDNIEAAGAAESTVGQEQIGQEKENELGDKTAAAGCDEGTPVILKKEYRKTPFPQSTEGSSVSKGSSPAFELKLD